MVHNAAWRRGLLCVLALYLGFASPPCKARIYTNHWAVRIAGGPEVADRIAEKYGYRNMGQVCVLLLIDPVKVASNLCLSVFSSTLKIGLNMPLPRRQSCAIKPQSLKSKPEPTRVLLTLKQTREGEALRNKESRPAAGWHNRCHPSDG